MSRKDTHWAGGYIRWGKRGPTYVIERWIDGVRFHVSTRRRTEAEALEELVRWREDPHNYVPSPRTRPKRVPLCLTDTLILEYRDWMLTRPKPASVEWANTCARMLADWMEDLGRKDIRDLSITADLKPALARRMTSRMHRIEALKAFCAWLRKEKGLLRHAEDPTLDLAVPQAAPAKLRRRKVAAREDVRKALEVMTNGEVRDLLLLQVATAFHLSECRRFAQEGEILEPPPGTDLLAIIRVKHKSGEPTRAPIRYPEHLAAARRIRARGRIPSRYFIDRAIDEACTAAKVPYFHPGSMRHSVMTWAVEAGAHPRDVAEFGGHKSDRTTRKFYLDTAYPTVTVPVLRLVSGGEG